MFCIKCGTQIAEEASFCHQCGAKVVSREFMQQSKDMLSVANKSNNIDEIETL